MDAYGRYALWWDGLSEVEQAEAKLILGRPIPIRLLHSLQDADVTCVLASMSVNGTMAEVWLLPTALATFIEDQP